MNVYVSFLDLRYGKEYYAVQGGQKANRTYHDSKTIKLNEMSGNLVSLNIVLNLSA